MMSDYTKAFAISASGMSLERLRLEVASNNLANADAARPLNGRLYAPERVVAGAANQFEGLLNGGTVNPETLRGVGPVQIQQTNVAPRLESDPGNPLADAQGFVAYPAVNSVEEMITVMSSVRAFESDARALESARTMALKAIEIGAGTP
jgi:flagellar basal-body rod protein FlgC